MAVTGQNSAGSNARGFQTNQTNQTDANRDTGEVTREMAVGPLLARANLLRMRGQWEEAIAVCTEALLQAPKSPTAHSVLGDIYEAQNKYDDAMQWYGMAIDLAPNRTSDREKLERLVTLQRGRLRAIDKERSAGLQAHRAQMAGKLSGFPAPNTSGTGGRAAAERTVEWFDRVFPPGRSESIARLIFALCGIIAVLIASAAVFVYTSSSKSNRAAPLFAEGGTNASGLPALAGPRPPVTVVVPASKATPSARSEATAKLAAPAAAAPTPGASATETPTLQSVLAQNLPPGVTVTALRGNGAAGSPYQLEIALPKAVSEPASSTQERIIRGAALAARTLAVLDNRSTQIIVRAYLRDGVIGASGSLPSAVSAGTADTLAFQGDISAAAIRAVDPAITPTASLQNQFTGTIWSAFPASASDSAVSGAPVTPSPTPLTASSASPTPS